jgi:hypothetical protein
VLHILFQGLIIEQSIGNIAMKTPSIILSGQDLHNLTCILDEGEDVFAFVEKAFRKEMQSRLLDLEGYDVFSRPKVLVCEYERLDRDAVDPRSSPIVAKFSWLGDDNDTTAPLPPQHSKDFPALVHQLPSLLTDLPLCLELYISERDISFAEAPCNEGDSGSSTAWILTAGGHVVAEGFGDAPNYEEILRLINTKNPVTIKMSVR